MSASAPGNSNDAKLQRFNKLGSFAFCSLSVCWLLASWGLLWQLFRQNHLLVFSTDQDGIQAVDFMNFYSQAQCALDNLGKSTNIYDFKIQSEYYRRLLLPLEFGGQISFLYPPQMRLLMLWLPLFPPLVSWLLWNIIGTIGLVATVLFTNFSAKGFLGLKAKSVLVCLMLVSYPYWVTLHYGQTSLLMCCGIMIYAHLVRARKYFLAGFCAPFLLLKLQFLPLPLAFGIILGRSRLLLGLLAGGALAATILSLIFGPNLIPSYIQALLSGDTASFSTTAELQMQNVRGQLILGLLNESKQILYVSYGISGLLLLACTALWWRYRDVLRSGDRPDVFERLLGVSVLVMLIASPHAFIHDYLLAVWGCWLLAGQDVKGCMQRFAQAVYRSFAWVSIPLGFLYNLFLLFRVQSYFVYACFMIALSLLAFREGFKDERQQ